MAAVDSVSFDESGSTLTIESLSIEDEGLVEFVSGYESSERPEVVAEALKIGMRTMQLMDTSQDVEYVERRLSELEDELAADVETLQTELQDKLGDSGDLEEALDRYIGENGRLEERIDAAFDDEGPFVERLNKELGEDGGRIQQALDPDKEGSPTYRLQQRLEDEIESIKEAVIEQEAEEELRSRTYLKGGDFEETIEGILGEIVRQTPSDVRYTGETTGEMGRDVGDFVVNIADTGQNIVVEAKTEQYSLDNIKTEMEEAIQNRDAAYSVFVTDTIKNLPRTKTGWFHEFPEQNTVVVAMSGADDDDIEPGYLRIAFNWARMRAVQDYASVGSDFDPDTIRSEVTEIEEEIGRFSTVRGQCDEIQKSKEKIEDTLDEIQRDIIDRLTSIEAELTKGAS